MDRAREDNLRAHAAVLDRLLDVPALDLVHAHAWRCHYWLDDELRVVQLTRYRQPQQNGARVVVKLTRGYQPGASDHVAFLSLPAQYRAEDIVAFLRFDRVPVSSIAWEDITDYGDGAARVLPVGITRRF